MKKEVVLIGVGEMGGVFARGFLTLGHPVFPIGRETDLAETADRISDPQAVIVAVGEKDLPNVLDTVPPPWRGRLVLLQNELLPRDWQAHDLPQPTVISVWFEKKTGQDVKVLIPSPVFGPHARLVQEALQAVHIDCTVLQSEEALLFELVVKNVYILTVNIAGLKVGGTVGELWQKHQALAKAVAQDVVDIQFRLTGKKLSREGLIDGMVKAFHGDPEHKCLGRSAPARLKRALEQAGQLGLEVKTLREIDAYLNKTAVS
jgi:hypothetical protein